MKKEGKVGPPASKVLETEVEGEISLYNPANEQVTILNGTASDVWLLCDGEHTQDEIVSLLASSYEVDEDGIRDEVAEAIEEFQKAGLLSS